MNALALRVALCLSALVHIVLCIVWYAMCIIQYIKHLCTYISNDPPTFLHLTMPAFFPLFFFFFIPSTTFVIHHGQHVISHFNNLHAHAIVSRVTVDGVDLAHALAVDQAAR